MSQCPPFVLTFMNNDIFNTDLVDNNSYAHYVLRTPANNGPSGRRATPENTRSRPSLVRKTVTRNPTIIVRPKSSSSEAKIVASLQWHHWADSVFSTRWQVVRLDKMLPLVDSDDRSYSSSWVREVLTTKGTWHWCARPGGGLQLRDTSDKVIARFKSHDSTPESSEQSPSLPRLSIEFRALDLLDLIVTSLLVVVHELEQDERFYPSRGSSESIEDGMTSFAHESDGGEATRR